ncbi:MAG: hypothetical protein ACRCUY_13215 [Thermoguttaceae bacterium]
MFRSASRRCQSAGELKKSPQSKATFCRRFPYTITFSGMGCGDLDLSLVHLRLTETADLLLICADVGRFVCFVSFMRLSRLRIYRFAPQRRKIMLCRRTAFSENERGCFFVE